MEEPGRKLKRSRERLNLRYRDVEEASQKLATRHRNPEYYIALSRLADIENRGTVPSIFRLYSLCVIYRLDFTEVLTWYGVRLNELPSDAAQVDVAETHLLELADSPGRDGERAAPEDLSGDPVETMLLKRHIRDWGRLPLQMLSAREVRRNRFGFVGSEDWSMYPLLRPGSLIQIDESRRRVTPEGWAHESERPIYFVEYRVGYSCCWCNLDDGHLVLQFHPSSGRVPKRFRFPEEAVVIGQVVGVAMRLDLANRRHTHS